MKRLCKVVAFYCRGELYEPLFYCINVSKKAIYFSEKYDIIKVPSQLNIFYWINDFIINDTCHIFILVKMWVRYYNTCDYDI